MTHKQNKTFLINRSPANIVGLLFCYGLLYKLYKSVHKNLGKSYEYHTKCVFLLENHSQFIQNVLLYKYSKDNDKTIN